MKRLIVCLLTAVMCLVVFSACADKDTHEAPDDTLAVITDVQAESYALDHVGLSTNEVSGLRSVYTYDNRTPHYEVHFFYNGSDYHMNVHAENGQVLSLDVKAH